MLKIQSKLLVFLILINFFIFSYQRKILAEELIWIVNESKTIKLEISDNFHKRKNRFDESRVIRTKMKE